ncbi:MAG: right-handed parallel beta-helix repeat-containing protein [Bacteroidales bacterium]|nr:right-handed parallel beta-helix repeat-containing protein [Bacteroidales bacterium]
MKARITIIGFSLIFSLILCGPGDIVAQTCTFSVDSTSPYIDALSSRFQSLKPGDTVCLKAGKWDYIYLKNFHGADGKPITFVNSGGAIIINTQNYFGIKIGNSSYINFRGNGDPNIPYGFQIDSVAKGAGMGIDDLSTNIEISHVEISHTAIGGVYAKTDPTCGNYSATRDKFTMYDFSFHDCYVHDVPNEGLYIGNSHYTGQYLYGCDTTVYPHVMKGVHIYNNIIKRTGYDGIQVSSADSDCQIHDNAIYSNSYQGTLYQMSGIIIGGGSKCDTYNNKIINGKGDGIDVFGLGNYKIFNNLIVNSGQNYYPDSASLQKHGIYVGTDSTSANAQLGIYNNTIVNPKSFGIDLNNSKLSKISVINNLIVHPGKYATDGAGSFINNVNGNSGNIVEKTNYTTDTISKVKFINPDSLNYDLKASSPAVDYGTDLTAEGITFDILNRSRPFHNYFDAGAYESHDPSVGIAKYPINDVQIAKVFPNPASQIFQLELIMKTTQKVKVSFSDAMGRTLFYRQFSCMALQTCNQAFEIMPYTDGWYFLNIFTQNGKTSIPVIVQH